MTMPRYSQISVEDTPWYHVICRCVRRAFLCGEDSVTGQSFEHRRDWIEQRIGQLSSVFAIDVASYAVMSNHYHVVVRIDTERVENWTDDEVLQRWTRIFSGPLFVRRYMNDNERAELSDSELDLVSRWVNVYRQRLSDLSWYMRVLNETIARKANAEDQCTGRFWEGRFKSQALLDDQAVLLAMSYVDLNPVRAGIADTPEESTHTSIHQRIHEIKTSDRAQISNQPVSESASAETSNVVSMLNVRSESGLCQLPVAPLLPFDATETLTASVPFRFDDYLELIDALGRAVHPQKRGYIPDMAPAILIRMGLDAACFFAYADSVLKPFAFAVGAPDKLSDLAGIRGSCYLHGVGPARRLYQSEGRAA